MNARKKPFFAKSILIFCGVSLTALFSVAEEHNFEIAHKVSFGTTRFVLGGHMDNHEILIPVKIPLKKSFSDVKKNIKIWIKGNSNQKVHDSCFTILANNNRKTIFLNIENGYNRYNLTPQNGTFTEWFDSKTSEGGQKFSKQSNVQEKEILNHKCK